MYEILGLLWGFILTFALIAGLLGTAILVVQIIAYFKLCAKAGYDKPWLVFLPFGTVYLKFRLAGIPKQTFFLALATPMITSLVAGIFTEGILGMASAVLLLSGWGFVLATIIIVEKKFLEAWGWSPWLMLLAFVPLGLPILYLVTAFGEREYLGELK